MPDFTQLEDSYRRYALYEKGHRPTTVKDSLRLLRLFHSSVRCDQIEHVSTSHIRQFLQFTREQRGWSAKTFRIYRQHLKTFFDWAVSENHTRKNPVIGVESPRLPQLLPRCLSPSQVERFLAHAYHYPWRTSFERFRNRAILATFLYTGIRLQELLGLHAVDVDLKASELRVRRGKGEKERLIALYPALQVLLRDYENLRKQQPEPSVWYFPSSRSASQLTIKNLYAVFEKLSAVAGLKVTPHMLRHTFGRMSIESGMNTRIIQETMGHASLKTTERYTHVTTQAKKDAMRKAVLR